MSGATVVSIAEKYRVYLRAVVLPFNPTQEQIVEARRAFHAGFLSCLVTMKVLSMLSEDEACEMLQALDDETKRFTEDLGTPREPREG